MDSEWFLETKKADFAGIAARFGIDQVTARILRNRDIVTDEQISMFLNGDDGRLYDPRLMMNAEKAAEMISAAIKNKVHIRIIGDYDVDGVCSAYILLTSIKKCGGIADAAIPHRVRDGYGINETLIDDAVQSGAGMIVTCDNGIAAYEQVAYAEEHGLKVVVTDHHEIPHVTGEDGLVKWVIPPADAVVNPHQAGDAYPYKLVCGAVVAWKVSQILMEMLCPDIAAAVTKMLMVEAALATVCDVMPLLDENRIIVKKGFEILEKGGSNIGLDALIRACGLNDRHITSYSAGFVIGPCINASGRLATAEIALSLLCADDTGNAEKIAGKLVELNNVRKTDTEEKTAGAFDLINEKGLSGRDVMVVYLPECSESIAGIIAGRIRERYEHPVFVVTRSEDGLKGSGRSTEAFDMYAHMSRHPELFSRFGGHKAAAGFSMEEDKLELFEKLINEDTGLTKEDFVRKVRIDVPMPVEYLTPELIDEFGKLEPFGNCNPRPLFAQKDVKILSRRRVGKKGEYGKYLISTGKGRDTDMMFFGDAGSFNEYLDSHDDSVSIVYYPEINEFRGVRSIQIILTDYR